MCSNIFIVCTHVGSGIFCANSIGMLPNYLEYLRTQDTHTGGSYHLIRYAKVYGLYMIPMVNILKEVHNELW